MVKIIVIVVIALLLIPLAIVLIRFNLKRVRIIKQAISATDDQLERVYRAIERKQTEPPTCAVLARTNRTASPTAASIPIPDYVRPWVGKSINIVNGVEVKFSLSDVRVTEPAIAGKVFRILPVPRRVTKTGKSRNQLAPKQYISGNPELMAALSDISPRYPAEVLAYLLSAGMDSFEFDPINQARIGGRPSWIQDPEFVNCDECKKRMDLILQLPGTLLPGKPNARATFYLFGCPAHLDQTKTIVQYD